jgi:hypothetical protein
MDGDHDFFSKGSTSASAPRIDLAGGHKMERLMRKIIPLQFACRERDIHQGGVSGDG